MKKIITLLITLLLLITISTLVFADNSESVNTQDDYYNEIEVNVNTVSNENSEKISIDSQANQEVKYNFQTTKEKDQDIYKTRVEGSITQGDEVYFFYASGETDYLLLDNGNTFIQGPLFGKISIDKEEYNVIIGFQGIEETNEAVFGMNIETVLDSKKLKDSFFIVFGNLTKDDKLLTEIEKAKEVRKTNNTKQLINESNNSLVEKSSSIKGTNSTFDYVKSVSRSFNGSKSNVPGSLPNGNAVTIAVYKDLLGNRLALTAKTYGYKFENFSSQELADFFGPYGNGHTIQEVKIDYFKMGMERKDGTVMSFNNFESLSSVYSNLGSSSSGNILLRSLFLDISGLFGFNGTWFVNAAIEAQGGSFSKILDTDSASVEVNVNNFDVMDFDYDPMAIALHYIPNFAGYTDYSAFTDIIYHINTDLCLFYVEVPRVSTTFTVYESN